MLRIQPIVLLAIAGLSTFISLASCAQSDVVVASDLDAAVAPQPPPEPGFIPPPPEAGADAGNRACEGLSCNMVDILFVVDNSISMGSAQKRLKEAFPAFLNQVKTQLKDVDFHLMVVDSDASGYERRCASSCPSPEYDGSVGTDNICQGFSCASISARGACDITLGAGSVYPVGRNTANRDCNFPNGRRYLTSQDDDVEERFLCSAAVGTAGDGDERPIGAMLAALEVESREGGCNEGFLRDDALLVVVVVTDAGTSATELDTARALEWRERLLALKCGREEGVVVTTISHDGTQIAPWYSSMTLPIVNANWDNNLTLQWREFCGQVPGGDPCCCQKTCPRPPLPPEPGCIPDPVARACEECAGQPPPMDACWFAFTGYGASLVRFADAFGERGSHREICEDFSDVLDGTLESVKKACVNLK
ncbi:MAG: VWA domain-containing protein [Labilithrix sp.]|nr:VWA domain-containing protein [Labilithrix sp.]